MTVDFPFEQHYLETACRLLEVLVCPRWKASVPTDAQFLLARILKSIAQLDELDMEEAEPETTYRPLPEGFG